MLSVSVQPRAVDTYTHSASVAPPSLRTSIPRQNADNNARAAAWTWERPSVRSSVRLVRADISRHMRPWENYFTTLVSYSELNVASERRGLARH